MNKALRYSVLVALSSTAVFCFLILTIAFGAKADTTNLGQSADQQCITQCNTQKQLADQKKDPTLNCPALGKTPIACKATAPGGGTVTGQCIYQVGCKALTATGSNGKSSGVGDLSSLLSGIGSIMKALGAGSSAATPPPAPTTPTGAPTGCTQYYQVSTPSSDPCAYYVPQSVGSSINLNTGTPSTGTTGSGTDISGLGSGTDTSGAGNSNPISNLISNLLGGDTTNTNTNDNTSGASSTVTVDMTGGVASSTAQGATNVGPASPDGANGEIRILPNGATIVITNQNSAGNTVTAGFLGTQATGGAQPTGIAASWCRTRPWASNFLSFIIPPTFFDSLCSIQGFQVGESTFAGGPAQIGNPTTYINNPASGTNISATTYVSNAIPQSPAMSAQIWAVPSTVALGGRTTIFWSSKNAASCTETSPDGSFSHTTLAGGGATVPLSGATDFTISCMAPDGSHTTADVVVPLAL